jgi:hypothetical protein
MTLTIELQPDVERSLQARAQAKGVTLADFAQELLAREAEPLETPLSGTGLEVLNAGENVRGLFSDEEIDRLFSRTPSFSRDVDFS